MNPQLTEQVNALRAQNKSNEEIATILTQEGHSPADVAMALAQQPSPLGQNPSLPGIGALFAESWQTYTSRFTTLVGVYLLPSVLGSVVGVLALWIFADQSSAKQFNLAYGIILLIAGIVAIYIGLLSQIALVHAVADEGPKIGILDAYKKANGKVASFLWISLIIGLVIFGGTILLIIPGLIFAVWYYFASYVFVTEGIKGTAALQKSREYVRGFGWQIVFRYLVIAFAFIAVYFIIGVLTAFSDSQIANTVIQIALNAIIAPFLVCYSFIIFRQIKQVKGEVTVTGGRKGIIIAAIWGLIAIPLLIIGFVLLIIFSLKKVQNSGDSAYNGFINAPDTRRIADIAGLQGGLEFYKFKNGTYPQSLAQLIPDYYKSVPKAPTPPDGTCSQKDNEYSYVRSGKDNYSLRFCLGKEIGGYKAGLNTVTAESIHNSSNSMQK